MEKKNLERIYNRIEEFIFERKLKDALDALKDLVISSRRGEFISQFEALDDTYENLLKYAIEGVQDPERDNIYNHLLISVLELADVSLQYATMNQSEHYIYRLKKRIESESKQIREEVLNSIEDLVLEEELSEMLQTNPALEKEDYEAYMRHQEILQSIFNLIWLTDKFNDSDENLLQSIWKSTRFPWHEKSIIISGLTLSAIRCFDHQKISLLIEFSLHSNMELRQRALVGLFLTLYIYDKRLFLYPDLLDKIRSLKSVSGIEKHLELIVIQFLKSKQTEKITKKLQEEIIPEMVKFQPVLRDKLDLDNILSKDFVEDKNPDWERVFEDAPDLLDKLQEISKLQMEGADVFMSTFARLKHFEFFNELVNWFRPFYKENIYLRKALESEKDLLDTDAFLEGLSFSFFMCNSDKYSFCLNLKEMPDLQKSMMLDMFNAELEGIKELQKEDDLLHKPEHMKSIYSQYIHDLYRFYKLNNMRYEMLDIFSLPFEIHQSQFIQTLVDDHEIIRNIAEYFFENENFNAAYQIYLTLTDKGDASQELFEKMGYCLHKLKNFEMAISYYKKAELFEVNRAWNLRKIALCYRHLQNYTDSLSFFLEAEKMEPDNLYVQTFIGHTYLDLKEYEKALEYYYKVEFLAAENKKVLRPIAWCSFVLGKLETAKKYLERLIAEDANKYDFMNLGHVEWCLGNRQEAIRNYKLSVNRNDNNLKLFMTSFAEDKHHLVKLGIDELEIPLMVDYLKYQL
jgi:tetratricopeptide (TPR) repeat protein